MKQVIKFLAFSLVLMQASCGTADSSAGKQEEPKKVVKPDSVNHVVPEKRVFYRDSLLDFTARYLAGLNQLCRNPFLKLEQEPAWMDHRSQSQKNWDKLLEDRIQPMMNWSAETFKPMLKDSLTVFYPFSGPDFLHVHYLYPNATRYILCALEPISDLPDLLVLNPENRSTYLKSLQNSLRDIYGKSYFITNHMKEDLSKDKVRGVLPLFYVFLVRTGHEILQIDPVALDTAGVLLDTLPEKKSPLWISGIRFRFRHENADTLREMIYFSTDISDKGLKKNPAIIKFVQQQGSVNTFIKSASYLLHYSTFSMMREQIMASSSTIFQDDTGIPYKHFKSASSWRTVLYGNYTKPVKDFGSFTFQDDLDSVYSASKGLPSLPFHLGYHWGDRKQSQQLFIRK